MAWQWFLVGVLVGTIAGSLACALAVVVVVRMLRADAEAGGALG